MYNIPNEFMYKCCIYYNPLLYECNEKILIIKIYSTNMLFH